MMSRLYKNSHWRNFKTQSRFITSGGLATASHWSTMTLLVFCGFSGQYATIVGSTVGASFNYWLQKNHTFESRSPDWESIPKYAASCAASWLLNLFIFLVIQAVSDYGIALTQALTSLLVAFFNYHIYKRFVFHVSSQS